MSAPGARTWARVRVAGGVVVLAVLVWRLGTGPFLDGVRRVDAGTLLAGLLLGGPVTLCCAWRWRAVARAVGADAGMGLGAATAAYYRSQLLNTLLPGGVLGDVHRGVEHGRAVDDVPRSLRAVVWDRVTGQVVQLGIAAVVLLTVPSLVPRGVPWALGVVLLVALLAVLLAGGREPRALLAARTWPGVVLASTVAVVVHVVVFLVAARTAGVSAPTVELVPLALVVLVAMGIPANVAGWGPREGVAAWAFAAAGLGAQQGLATAVVYGVMAFVAALPGLVVLAASRQRRQPGREVGRASALPPVAEPVIGVVGRG
jgi:hypothetical protein